MVLCSDMCSSCQALVSQLHGKPSLVSGGLACRASLLYAQNLSKQNPGGKSKFIIEWASHEYSRNQATGEAVYGNS